MFSKQTESTRKREEIEKCLFCFCLSARLSVCLCIYQTVLFSAVHVFAGVTSVSIDVGKEEVLVESALTSVEVQALIESTGRRAVLKGIGGSEQGEEPPDGSEAAYQTSILNTGTGRKASENKSSTKSLVRFVMLSFLESDIYIFKAGPTLEDNWAEFWSDSLLPTFGDSRRVCTDYLPK